MAIVLLAWCLVFVIGAEQVGKPFVLRAILRSREEIHAGLVFLSLLGGIEMFGLIGVVLGPLMVAFFLSMVRIYERDFREALPPGSSSTSKLVLYERRDGVARATTLAAGGVASSTRAMPPAPTLTLRHGCSR